MFYICSGKFFHRGVAQLASVLAWGARGRKFESSRPDRSKPFHKVRGLFYFASQACLSEQKIKRPSFRIAE